MNGSAYGRYADDYRQIEARLDGSGVANRRRWAALHKMQDLGITRVHGSHGFCRVGC